MLRTNRANLAITSRRDQCKRRYMTEGQTARIYLPAIQISVTGLIRSTNPYSPINTPTLSRRYLNNGQGR
jgi:hypothetical protein